MARSVPFLSRTTPTHNDTAGILITQWMPAPEATAHLGERLLLTALIETAIWDIRKYWRHDGPGSRIALDAWDWVMSTDPARKGFSFAFCCDHLGLSADRIRRQVMGWAADMNDGMALSTRSILRRTAGNRCEVRGRSRKGGRGSAMRALW